jgi:hypothetical protein
MKYIAMIDDAEHCAALLLAQAQANPGAQWVLVACAPRMTHRVSKWVSHSSREQWRQKWAEKLFFAVAPRLRAHAAGVATLLSKGPVQDEIDTLLQSGPADVLDFRKPRAPEGQHQPRGWSGQGQSREGGRVHWGWIGGPVVAWLAVFAE